VQLNTDKTRSFIEESKNYHGNRFDYTDVVYVSRMLKIRLKCNKHNKIFLVQPKNHLSKSGGCKDCKRELMSMPEDDFIKRAIECHGTNYDYSKVNYITSKIKVTIICKKHNKEFEQTPHSHLQGSGCPDCGKDISDKKKTMTLEDFINKSIQVHGNKYDYSKVIYINSETVVDIICKKHGIFRQFPFNHYTRGMGCKKCAYESKLITFDQFINKSIEVHGNRYDYFKTKYIGCVNKVITTCRIHGDFQQLPNNHVNGNGCPKCDMCPKCQIWRSHGKICNMCKNMYKKIYHQKTKELAIVKFLKKTLPDYEFIHNRSVGRDCTEGHLFPDIRFDCGHYHLIVEIDEHRHRGSQYECDEQRMRDVIAKLGQPCVFIRYNPDSKESDRNELLDTIEEYIDLNEDNIHGIFDNYGLKCVYLFY